MNKYGFQNHLSSEFPSQIVVDVTQYCNLECIHCPHSNYLRPASVKKFHLKKELHKKLIDEIASYGYQYCKFIRYTANGEPLLHPDLDEMLKDACKRSKTKTNLTTNGILLTEEKAEKLLDMGINVFDISIDAFSNSVYSNIRQKGKLEVVVKNVRQIIKLKKEKGYSANIVVSFVQQPLNEHETEEFERFWYNEGVDYVVIRRLHSAGGVLENVKKNMKNSTEKIKRKPCLYPWERLTLSPEGMLGYCPTDWEGKSHFADFSETTIKSAWRNGFMKKLREAHLENNFDPFEYCKNCPDWVQTRWPWEGRAYFDLMKEVS